MNWKRATQAQRDAKNERRRDWRAKRGVNVGSRDGAKSVRAREYILGHRDMTIVAVAKKTGISYGLVQRVYSRLVCEGLVVAKRDSSSSRRR